jgi:iron transport multicopper oxidase
LLWTVWSSGWLGNASQLRAYDAVPSGGSFNLRFVAAIGDAAKYALPGVGEGRIYVGTRDGLVIGFGVQPAVPLQAAGLAFASALAGDSVANWVTLTAAGPVKIQQVDATGDFLIENPSSVPRQLSAREQLRLSVIFAPTVEGLSAGTLTVVTDRGTLRLPLVGTGDATTSQLEPSSAVVTFGAVVNGDRATQTVDFTNVSDAPMVVNDILVPPPPFAIADRSPFGVELMTGDTWSVTVAFAPSAKGVHAATFSVLADDVTAAAALEGSAVNPGHLRMVPTYIDVGTVAADQTAVTLVRLTNDGDRPLTLTSSWPSAPGIQLQPPVASGTTIAPGASLVQTMAISPPVQGPAQLSWEVIADDEQETHTVAVSVSGKPAAPAVVPDAGMTRDATGSADERAATNPANPANDGGSAGAGEGKASPLGPGAADASPSVQGVTSHGPVACSLGGEPAAPSRFFLWRVFGWGAVALVLSARRRRR